MLRVAVHIQKVPAGARRMSEHGAAGRMAKQGAHTNIISLRAIGRPPPCRVVTVLCLVPPSSHTSVSLDKGKAASRCGMHLLCARR